MATLVDRINGLESSVAIKVPVDAATTTSVTLNGIQTVDTIILTDGYRVLVKDQSNLTENGIYDVVSNGDWTRALDFDGPRDVVQGTCVYVRSGDVSGENVKHFFEMNIGANPDSNGNVVFGQTSITFDKIFFESEIYAQEAQDAAADAEEARIATEAAAAAIATSLQGTSTTSIAIATGSKVFATQTGRAFGVGVYVLIQSAANSANFMHGRVTAYAAGSLTVNVTAFGGTGTLNDWVISVSGPQGATGAAGGAGAGTGDMLKSENLSGLANYATARSNLGLGALAILSSAGVSVGGTGRTSHTAYSVLCGGTSPTNPQQSVASVGTAGQVLKSNGPGALPSFQTLSDAYTYGSISSNTGSSLDITGIPSSVTEIDLYPASCQTNGNNSPYLRLRDSGGLEITGYKGTVYSTGSGVTNHGSSFLITNGFANNTPISGMIRLRRVSTSADIWNIEGQLGFDTANQTQFSFAGTKELTDDLDGLSIITADSWVGGALYYRYK